MPNASTRFEAWDLTMDSLAAISVATGFWSNVASVTTEPPNQDATTGGPWLVMSFGGEDFGEPSVGGYYNTSQVIHVDGYIVRDGSDVENACKLLQDVRRVVTETLVGMKDTISNVTGVWLVASDQDTGWLEYADGLVSFRQSIEIRYKTRSDW